jgi:hypothetical protein
VRITLQENYPPGTYLNFYNKVTTLKSQSQINLNKVDYLALKNNNLQHHYMPKIIWNIDLIE